MFHLFKNLFLHGEGGDGGAGAAPGAEAPGAEAAGVTTPDAGEKRRPNKAERRAALEAKLKAEQQQAQTVQQEQPKQERLPFEEIEKLYKDEIGQRIQNAVTGRVKNLKDSEAELNALKERAARQEALIGRMSQRYGIKAGDDGQLDLDACEKAVDDDDELYEERAAERGWSTDTEKYVSKLERQADELKAMREQQAKEEEARQRDFLQRQAFAKRMEETEAARKLYPGIDLGKEMENRTFASLMTNPLISVQQAYELVHREELMALGQQAAAQQATQALASRIQAGQSMPLEGGLSKNPAANPQRTINPRNLSRAERKELNKRAMRGEYISW